MRILFIQLPLLDHSHAYIQGNVPLASACTGGYIKKRLKGLAEIDYLPFVIENYSSNHIIAGYVKSLMPDLVCFTSYLWNVERSLAIAEEIKMQNPRIDIFMGGPEIHPDSWVFTGKRDYVDGFVTGEGEWFFHAFLNGALEAGRWRSIGGNHLCAQREDELIDPLEIVEPFAGREINLMTDGTIFLELTRGCPYRCSYCTYSKHFHRIREMPFKRLLDALEIGATRGLNEIYILVPTFNSAVDFTERLKALARLDHGVRLHTEIRAEGIDAATAALMYRAGFRSLEIGLQTLSSEALRNVRRGSDPESEMRGMLELKKAGIDLKIGIIPGLPGDTIEQFNKTIRRLIDEGLGDSIEIYPLSILPGAGIRSIAKRDKVLVQEKPPYYLIEGWGFDPGSIRSIIEDVESLTGLSPVPRRLPSFIRSRREILIGGVMIADGRPQSAKTLIQENMVQTNVFDIHFRVDIPERLLEWLGEVFNPLPLNSQLYNIIFHTDALLNERDIVRLAEKLDEDSFNRRSNTIFGRNIGTFMFYQVLSDLRRVYRAEESYTCIEAIYRADRKRSDDFLVDHVRPRNVLVGKGSLSWCRKKLIEYYGDDVESVAFEDEEEQKSFYEALNLEYVRLPFSFEMRNLS
jgi:radical SAM superfamily enzyme YgiQ (UPF0313 family)